MWPRIACLVPIVMNLLQLLVIIALPLKPGDELVKKSCRQPFNSSSVLGKYRRLAVSSDAPGCAEQGVDILIRGGSAVDAAITTLLCNGLVNMHSMGIGGGFIMVYYNATERKSYVLDSRETAPAAAREDMFLNRPAADKITGPLAIAVPSEIYGMHSAWKRFGRLPWSELFTNAIKMAEIGTTVTPTLAKEIRLIRPYLKEDFALRAMADDLAEMGSIITLDDLLNYHPIWRKPIRMQIRRGPVANAKTDFEMHAAPPPSSGVLVGLALNMISKYNYSNESDKQCERGYLYYHRVLETFKFVFAKRSHLSDEAFLSENATKLLEQLQTLQFADELQSMIVDEHTQNLNYYGSVWSTANQEGTSHISILADNGDAVAVTSTINTKFGSKMVGRRTGVLFNNEMDDFSSPNSSDYFGLAPARENFIRPGKRPLSSMSPVIFTHPTNGSVRLVIGASGGSLILTSVVNTRCSSGDLRVKYDRIDLRSTYRTPVARRCQDDHSPARAQQLIKLNGPFTSDWSMLRSRMPEHKLAVRRDDEVSQLATHAFETGHEFNFAATPETREAAGEDADSRFTEFLRLLVRKEDDVALKFFLNNQDKLLTEEACGPMSKLFKKRLADRADEDKEYAKIVIEAEERRKRLEEEYNKKSEEFEARRRRCDTAGIEQLDMRPASPATRHLLYTGVSSEGLGRSQSLSYPVS
ncbi:hypothetical protein SprV_0100200000 [Sparganum proliferum]